MKYPKWCVYWIGPFIPMVFTADVEMIGALLQQSGGKHIFSMFTFKRHVLLLLYRSSKAKKL